MIKGGYLLKAAYVNLKQRRVVIKEVDEDFAIKHIGGRGWGARVIYDLGASRIDPISPENIVVVSSGPLSGLPVPSSGKLSFSSISPATGLYGDSNVGGELGVAIKRAGFDMIVLMDMASSPSLIVVEDGSVNLVDGEQYWGMGCLDAEKALKRDFGAEARVAVIGPAGENLVKIASINSDFGRQAARCGIAAVMGGKKVKAIVAIGDGHLHTADPEAMSELFEATLSKIRSHRDLPLWQSMGTTQTVEWANAASCLPTRNFSAGQFEAAEAIGGKALLTSVRMNNKGCFLCEMLCGQVSAVDDLTVEGPEYETLAMLGSNCGLASIKEIVRANYICDQLGLDTISAGNIVAFAMECYERGLIDREFVGGLDLRFGNAEALYEALEKIAYRRGFGAILAEGVAKASGKIGKASSRFAMHVKGLEISGYDVRAAPAMALAYATCDIGAHHNRAWAIAYDVQKGRTIYGVDKVSRVIYLQHVRPMFDCLGVCRFPWLEMEIEPEVYAQFYTAATGVKTSLNELLKRSEAIWNMTRLINIRQGLTRADDWLPDRVFEDPLPSGPLKGLTLHRGEFRRMLEEYYMQRGWSMEGVPTKEKLNDLEIF